MDWTNFLYSIGTLLIGGGGIYSWYKARPEKLSFEIKNLRDVIEEIKSNRLADKAEYETNRKKTDAKIEELETRNDMLEKAVRQWLKCRFIPVDSNCPVAEFLDKEEEELETSK